MNKRKTKTPRSGSKRGRSKEAKTRQKKKGEEYARAFDTATVLIQFANGRDRMMELTWDDYVRQFGVTPRATVA